MSDSAVATGKSADELRRDGYKAADAEADGYRVDRSCYPWVAYKGYRFNPDEFVYMHPEEPEHPADYVCPEELLNARIKLWFCPLDAEHRKEESGIRPTVEWDGDVATCLVCGALNDGLIACSLCGGRFTVDQLAPHDGSFESDVCKQCALLHNDGSNAGGSMEP
jgi:hypothetical protein